MKDYRFFRVYTKVSNLYPAIPVIMRDDMFELGKQNTSEFMDKILEYCKNEFKKLGCYCDYLFSIQGSGTDLNDADMHRFRIYSVGDVIILSRLTRNEFICKLHQVLFESYPEGDWDLFFEMPREKLLSEYTKYVNELQKEEYEKTKKFLMKYLKLDSCD